MLFSTLTILLFAGAQAAPVVDDRSLHTRSENATIGSDTLLAMRSTQYITCPQFPNKGVYAKRRTVEGIDLELCCETICAQGLDCRGDLFSQYVELYKLMVNGKPRCRNLSIDQPTDKGYFLDAVKPKSCDNGAVQCPNHPFACCVPKGGK